MIDALANVVALGSCSPRIAVWAIMIEVVL
jgi:hypothetical protein